MILDRFRRLLAWWVSKFNGISKVYLLCKMIGPRRAVHNLFRASNEVYVFSWRSTPTVSVCIEKQYEQAKALRLTFNEKSEKVRTTIYASATGRFIIEDDIDKVREFKSIYRISRITHKQIRDVLLPRVRLIIDGKQTPECELERDLVEEYIHHLNLHMTSLLRLADSCSLTFRFYAMFITDRLLSFLKKRSHTFSSTELTTEDIRQISCSKEMQHSFSDMLIHFWWLKNITIAVVPVIEGIALSLTENQPFHVAERRYSTESAKEFLSGVKKVINACQHVTLRLRQQGLETRGINRKVIEIGRIALNPPIKDLEKHGKTSVSELRDYLVERFCQACDQESGLLQITAASPSEVVPWRVYYYFLGSPRCYQKVKTLFYYFALKKPRLFYQINRCMAKLKYYEPGVMIIEEEGVRVKYDPDIEIGLGKDWMWREKMEGIEDLVDGNPSLAKYHKFLLDSIFYLGGSWWDEVAIRILQLFPSRSALVIDWLTWFASEVFGQVKAEHDKSKAVDPVFDLLLKHRPSEAFLSIYLDLYFSSLERASVGGVLKEVLKLADFYYIHGLS